MLGQAAVPILDSTASRLNVRNWALHPVLALFNKYPMADNGDKNPSSDSRGAWAKHFIIRVSGMYDVGDNANGTFQKTMPMPVW